MLGVSLFIKSNAFPVSSSTVCEGNVFGSWVETIDVSSTDERLPNSDVQILVLERTPEFQAASFLKINIDSFGTSSVQYACYFVNGEEVSFSSVPASMVGGYQVSESQYQCPAFVTIIENVPTNDDQSSSPLSLTADQPVDIQGDVGLAVEYSLTGLYILISYAGAIRAWTFYRKQKNMSRFRSVLNASFIILFSIWGTGTLVYTILFSVALNESNFFHIKTLLTFTYFTTYFLFYLIIHYR